MNMSQKQNTEGLILFPLTSKGTGSAPDTLNVCFHMAPAIFFLWSRTSCHHPLVPESPFLFLPSSHHLANTLFPLPHSPLCPLQGGNQYLYSMNINCLSWIKKVAPSISIRDFNMPFVTVVCKVFTGEYLVPSRLQYIVWFVCKYTDQYVV